MIDLFANASSVLPRMGELVPELQVNCTLSQCILHEHGCRNIGGMGKLEGANDLVYGTYPAQLRMLL